MKSFVKVIKLYVRLYINDKLVWIRVELRNEKNGEWWWMMIIVLHPRSDRHRSQKSRQANPCQLKSAKGRRGLSKCGLPRAGGALPIDDYCFAPPLGQAQVPKTQAGEALPTQSCEGQAEPCQMRVAKGRRSLANCGSKPRKFTWLFWRRWSFSWHSPRQQSRQMLP